MLAVISLTSQSLALTVCLDKCACHLVSCFQMRFSRLKWYNNCRNRYYSYLCLVLDLVGGTLKQQSCFFWLIYKIQCLRAAIGDAHFVYCSSIINSLFRQLLADVEKFIKLYANWELTLCCLFLMCYLLRFYSLGTKITKKYRNLSTIITEQINLFLHMEQKPHKKEELLVANSVKLLLGFVSGWSLTSALATQLSCYRLYLPILQFIYTSLQLYLHAYKCTPLWIP